MKHLLKLDELYKSTYKSAADKLKYRHKKRSEEIMRWAEERGKSELQKKHIEREHPYSFSFNSCKSLSDIKEKFLGEFYITNNDMTGGATHNHQVQIIMTSDWGIKISIKITYIVSTFKVTSCKILFNYQSGKFNSERDFLFNNRKDAIEIRKYLVENVSSIFKNMSLNDIYTSD